MLDPLPPPPEFLRVLSTPIARFFNLTTLPLHIHEVLGAALLYWFVQVALSPWASTLLFPRIYPKLNPRTRLNWDIHVVSLVQSCLVNTVALYVMWADEERWAMMDWKARVWGYTGACGMIQAFAVGYFLWDLGISLVHVNVFGIGLLAHAISALAVFSLGFKPFVNFYGPNFILYELSSPFLNFHWFFDKVNMTGSKAQWYNGILLIGTFFGCRLVWGTYQSYTVFQDIFLAVRSSGVSVSLTEDVLMATHQSVDSRAEVMRFAGDRVVPVWMAYTYLGSNITLNFLNVFWFSKMIETIRKRFQNSSNDVSIGKKTQDEDILDDTDSRLDQKPKPERAAVRQRRKD